MKNNQYKLYLLFSILLASLFLTSGCNLFKKVESIQIISIPDAKSYVEGIIPDFKGLEVKAAYDNGDMENIPLKDLTIDFYDPNHIGLQSVTVRYKNQEAYLTVKTRAKKLLAMEIIKPPDKTDYIQGMSIDLAGIEVKGTYDNDTKNSIDPLKLTVEDYDSEKTESQKVSVVSEGIKAYFQVTVIPKTLLGISFKALPEKTIYPEGVSLDLKGMTVVASYDNNIPEDIPLESLEFSGYLPDKLGEQTIIVKYKEYTLEFKVTVEPKKFIGIEIVNNPAKTTYTQGEELNLSGIKVSKIFNNGTKEDIPQDKLLISGFNKDRLGTASVTVSIEGFSDTFSVKVNSRVTPSSIISNPGALDVLVNKKWALPSSYVPPELIKVNVPVVYVSNEANLMRRPAANALKNLFDGASNAGLTLKARSGYRSYSTQKTLYEKNVATKGLDYASRYSAQPGHSEHQTGLSMDITCAAVNDQLYTSFGNTAEGRWVRENAHLYGFIIRYPSGKESITGYAYEPWHIRFLGVDLATKLYNSGLTMEEYFGN